ncbi:hypothetical protein JQ581_30335 [Bradyrhizobium liaoningense]|uniref:hypothetical protein n=1 Tax=Bradyrhizobium liaoningense TaxID=43992 RepID=UPI001BAA5D21|nr:hypothetical protein [Bradyrhizobium liaoningense]MBR0741238.1 hypothetical protein [Bradyrhizobium liaoningense]
MEIWEYDSVTGALLGQSAADPDPEREGNWLIPAFATGIRPPFVPPGCIAVFDGGLTGQGSWRIELKDDENIRRRLAPRIADLCAVIDDCCRNADLDRETTVRLVLEAAKETVERLEAGGLRADAIALLQDILGVQRVN